MQNSKVVTLYKKKNSKNTAIVTDMFSYMVGIYTCYPAFTATTCITIFFFESQFKFSLGRSTVDITFIPPSVLKNKKFNQDNLPTKIPIEPFPNNMNCNVH